MSEADEILDIWAVTSGNADDIAVQDIQRFIREFREYVNSKDKKIVDVLTMGEKVTDETTKTLQKAMDTFKKGFSTSEK